MLRRQTLLKSLQPGAVRFRKALEPLPEGADKMERNRRVPFFNPVYLRGFGTDASGIDGRDHTSVPFYPINETLAGRLSRKIAVPDLWWQPFNTPQSPQVEMRADYGRIGRPGRAAVGQGAPRIVVHQNPVAPMQATARGFESIDKAVRVGTFQAGMNIAATARRRRGQ